MAMTSNAALCQNLTSSSLDSGSPDGGDFARDGVAGTEALPGEISARRTEAVETTMDEVRNIRREVLPNGLIILTEEMPHLRSVSIGVWIKTGSRHEEPEYNGISHFIEHMVFKGTKSRSAEDIARQVDSIGGNMDAFTAKECVSFDIKVLDEHVPLALDIL